MLHDLLRSASGDWRRPALPRAGLHRPLGEPYSGPAPGTSPGNAGAKGQRRKQRTYGGREARAERHRNQRLTSSVHFPFTVRLSAGDAGRGIGKASGAPPARARASWVAYSLPGALPLR
jgi:hypothetical protein